MSSPLGQWIGREMEWLRSASPQSVVVKRIRPQSFVFLTMGDYPSFGEDVEMALPGDRDVALAGEVVALERIMTSDGGVQFTVYLDEPISTILSRLGASPGRRRAIPMEGSRPKRAQSQRESSSGQLDLGGERRASRPPDRRRPQEKRAVPEPRDGRWRAAGRTSRRDRAEESSQERVAKAPLSSVPEETGPESGRNLIHRGFKGNGAGTYGVHSSSSRRTSRPPRQRQRPERAPGRSAKARREPTPAASGSSSREPLSLQETSPLRSREQQNHIQRPSSRDRGAKIDEWGGQSQGWEETPPKRQERASGQWTTQSRSDPSHPSWDNLDSWKEDDIIPADGGPRHGSSQPPPPSRSSRRRRSSHPAESRAPERSISLSPEPSRPVREQKPSNPSESLTGVRQIGSRASGAHRAIRKRKRTTAPFVGLDFGTTFSKVAVLEGDEVVLVEDTSSKAATRAAIPSSIAVLRDGEIVVGEPAREFLASDPTRVISSIKRVLGLRYSDPLANGLLGSLACQSVPGPNDSILFQIDGRQFTVVEVTSIILKHLLQIASDWAGSPIRQAVLTYPVDFDRVAKRELELAAKMAGIEPLAFVPEPVAAVMGCGFGGETKSTVAVYDFGGGTFDASVVEVGDDTFSVLGSAGDRWLGGDDLDELLARHVADEYNRTSGINLHTKRVEFQRLLFACEEGKRWLSTLDKVDIILPRAALTAEGPKTLLVPVDRNDFEFMTEDVITSSLEICRQAAESAGMLPEDVDSLLLTGGTTRVPAVRAGAQRYFGLRGVAGVHPEHAVVIGAAVRAALATGVELPADVGRRLKDQVAEGHDVGLSLADGSTEPIIRASDPPPVTAYRNFGTSIDGQTACRIELVKGSDPHSRNNQMLGSFIIDGLPPRKAGTTHIDIYFELSSTGTLYVTAQDRATGQRAQGTFDLSDE